MGAEAPRSPSMCAQQCQQRNMSPTHLVSDGGLCDPPRTEHGWGPQAMGSSSPGHRWLITTKEAWATASHP